MIDEFSNCYAGTTCENGGSIPSLGTRKGSLAESGYCSGLENRGRLKGRVGSNPTASVQKIGGSSKRLRHRSPKPRIRVRVLDLLFKCKVAQWKSRALLMLWLQVRVLPLQLKHRKNGRMVMQRLAKP